MKIYLYSHQWRNPGDRTCQIVCEISPAISCFSIHHLLMHSFAENPSVKFHFCQSSSPEDKLSDEIERCIVWSNFEKQIIFQLCFVLDL